MNRDSDTAISTAEGGRSSVERGRKSAVVVAAGILISRLTGLLRQTVFAHFFGDTAQADAFNVALRIPNSLRNLLGEGTVGAAFIPAYSALIERDEKASKEMANAVLGILLLVASLLTVVGVVLAPWLAYLLAPGYRNQPEQIELVIRLTRVLFPMAGLMVISGWCLGVQNSHRRFFWSYASAALWSLAQIALLVGFGSKSESLSQLAWWLAWATLAGSALQVAAQLPEVIRLLQGLKPSLNRAAEGVLPVVRNFVPVVAAVGVAQLSGFIDQGIATFMVEGAVSNLFYANTLALLPVSLFGVSIVASSLPELSRDNAREHNDAVRERIRNSWARIFFYVVPSAVAFIVLGDYCSGIIYRSGKFGSEQQRIVHFVLAAYALGILSFASVRLLASVFHARQDYKTPLRAAALSLCVSAVVAASLAYIARDSEYAPAAIALGSALGSYVNFAYLMRGVRRNVGSIGNVALWTSVRRVVVAVVIATAVVLPLRSVLDPSNPRVTGPAILSVYGVVFLVSAWLMGSHEAARILRKPARGNG